MYALTKLPSPSVWWASFRWTRGQWAVVSQLATFSFDDLQLRAVAMQASWLALYRADAGRKAEHHSARVHGRSPQWEKELCLLFSLGLGGLAEAFIGMFKRDYVNGAEPR